MQGGISKIENLLRMAKRGQITWAVLQWLLTIPLVLMWNFNGVVLAGVLVAATFFIPLTDETLSFLSWLFNCANVKKVEYKNNIAKIILEAVPAFAEKIVGLVKQYNGTVKELVEIE